MATTSSTTYVAGDVLSNWTPADIRELDLTAKTAAANGGTPIEITTDGIEPLSGITITETAQGISIASTLATAVRYEVSGTLDGTLLVDSEGECEVYLDEATIAATDGPALYVSSAPRVFLTLAAGSDNTLSDSASRTALKTKAAIMADGRLVIGGTGALEVNAAYKHGVFSGNVLRITGGEIEVNVNARDGLRSVNGFVFDDGSLVVNATGTATDDESKGIKVEGSEGFPGQGSVIINGGVIEITSYGKAITAGWDIDEDATTTSTSDDPHPVVEVYNGSISITTTGTPYERQENGVTVSNSPEGIEGNSTLTITGDAIVTSGASAPEGAFDCDQNTFKVTGGTFVGVGGSNSSVTTSVSTQNVVVLDNQSLSSGTWLGVVAENGSVALAWKVSKSASTIMLSSPQLATGNKYTLYTGGTVAGGADFYGLILGAGSYSGGTAGTSFTVSSRVTTIGQSSGGGPGKP